MKNHRILETEDLLVAAAVARQNGFFETEQALYEMARCSACPSDGSAFDPFGGINELG